MRKLSRRAGFALPHISSRGVVDPSRPMGHDKHAHQPRHALTMPGVDRAVARIFAGQSSRARAATTAARADARPEILDDSERYRSEENRLAAGE